MNRIGGIGVHVETPLLLGRRLSADNRRINDKTSSKTGKQFRARRASESNDFSDIFRRVTTAQQDLYTVFGQHMVNFVVQ
jgi:hypothetical protein